MLQKLTTHQNQPVWINLAKILMMTRMSVQHGYPATKIVMQDGISVEVFESPDEISILAKYDRGDDMDDSVPD